ncbi:MAG: hypothetical protein BGO09_00865 [Bacteroidetes bacterium 47-18]|nr:MAG: hypothetical protein BGO09_00865 [Bacteroidetes bacterium 47-18]
MKKLLFTIFALGCLNAAYTQGSSRNVRPLPGPAPQINIADAKTFTLDNGLKVYVVENHKLPLVTYTIQFDVDVPNDMEKAGIKDFFGSMMSAGTKKRSKEQFIDDQDAIGSRIGVSYNFAFASALTKHQDKLLDIFSDCILNPNFSNEELIKIRKQAESSLQANENSADYMMNNVQGVVFYGANHPYSEVTTEQTIRNVNLSDISKYYRTYFKPNVAYMAIVGDITVEEAKKLVTKYFNSWQKGDVPKAKYPAVPQPSGRVVHFADRPGAVQSKVVIGNPVELKHTDPDLQSARVMNYILGGGSSSRLFTNLRENKAWTYGAYSSLSQDKEIGYVELAADCRNEVTDSSVHEMLQEMKSIRNQPVDEKVLQGAKNYINGVFALGLRNPQTIASYAINIDRYNLPKDYYKTYMQKTSSVTISDVKNAANKFLTPEQTNIIVVGNRTEVEKLKRFATNGEIRFYDKYGQPAAAIENKVINGQTADAIVAKYIQAIGGEAAIKGLTSLDARGTTEIYGTKADFEEKVSSPDKYYFGISTKVGNAMQTAYATMVNGEKGVIEQQGSRSTMPPAYVAVYKLKANLQSILQKDSLGVSYELESLTKLNGTDVYLINKYSDNGKALTRQYYDANTGLLLKDEEIVKVNNQESITTRIYKNYKEVKGANGYKVPHTIEEDADGRKSTYQYSNVKANGKIPGVYFK